MTDKSVRDILKDLPQSQESCAQVWEWLQSQKQATESDYSSVCQDEDGRGERIGAKRKSRDDVDGGIQPASKQSKSDSAEASTLEYFDPTDLIIAKEGTFKTPKHMRQYLDKHLRKCLTKEERDALFKTHPRPDLASCAPPKVDKFVTDFLGKKLPKERDQDLSKIQAAILACVRPLTSAWQQLLENGLEECQEMTVPGVEVLQLIQCTLCMVGNASEQVSQTRRARILETADKSWSKFADTDHAPGEGLLFGEDFQAKLTKGVEKDNSLVKALSITKRSQKPWEAPPTRKAEQSNGRFFRRSPATAYGSGRGRTSYPYNPYFPNKRTGEYSKGQQEFGYRRFNQRPRFHEPRLPQQNSFGKNQSKKP